MSSYGDWFRRQREQEQAGSARQDAAQKVQAAAAPSAGSGRRLELSKIDAQTARDHARLQGISDAAGARPKQQAGRTASAVQKAQSVMAAVEPGGSQIGQLAEEPAAKRQTGVPAARTRGLAAADTGSRPASVPDYRTRSIGGQAAQRNAFTAEQGAAVPKSGDAISLLTEKRYAGQALRERDTFRQQLAEELTPWDFQPTSLTEHEQILQYARENADPTIGQRLGYGAQSIGNSLVGTIPALAELAVQYGRNLRADAANPERQAELKEQQILLNRLEAIRQGYGNASWGTEEEIRAQYAANNERLYGELRASDPADPNGYGMTKMRRSAEYQQLATAGLEGVPGFLANTGLSIAGNAPAMGLSLVPGIGPALSMGVMGAQAAASKGAELNERGLAPEESLVRGLAAGGIEALTERFSIEGFWKAAQGVGAKTAIRNILRQAGVEASEESASYLLNYMADKAARDPEASFSVAELAEQAAGGALSGVFYGGVGTALDRALSNSGTQAQTTELAGTLSETPLQLVQKAGEQAAGLDSGTVEAVSGTAENVSRAAKPGVVRDAYSERVDRTTVDTIDRIAKRIGVEVEFSGRVAGNGDYRDGKIRIRTDAENPVRQVFVHELTHHLETSGGYQAFAGRVIEHLQKSGQDVELQTAAIVQEYARQGVYLSEDGARRELVAKFAEEKLFTDAHSIRRLTQADRSLAQKIRDWLHDMVIRLAGDAEQKFVQRAERMYAEALEGAKGRQTGETQYEIRYPQFTENDLAEGEAELVRMAPVAELTGREFPKGEIDLQTQVLDFFDSLGGNIFTERFGDVALTKSSWRSERRHGMTQVKAAAFAAIPQVLQNGAVVDVYEKNGGLSERIVVAAPIKIGAEAYYMGIMLQRDTQNQRLYLHDVYSEKTQDLRRKTQTWHHPEDGVSRSAKDLDMGSILQNAVNGKRRNAQNPGEDFDGQKSYGGSLSELNARLAKLSEEEKRALKAENRWQKAQGTSFDEQMFRARYEQAAEQLRRSVQVQRQLYYAAVHHARRRLELELETVRKQYPDFDLRTELDGDPRFKSLLLGDFDLLTAYQACHGQELFEAARRQMEEKARARIRENLARPVENGLQGGLPVRIGNDPSKWNRKQFREIEKRVQRGEKIYL